MIQLNRVQDATGVPEFSRDARTTRSSRIRGRRICLGNGFWLSFRKNIANANKVRSP